MSATEYNIILQFPIHSNFLLINEWKVLRHLVNLLVHLGIHFSYISFKFKVVDCIHRSLDTYIHSHSKR